MVRLEEAIEKGYRARAFQAVPHFIVLDAREYHAHLKPVLADWLLLWLNTVAHIRLEGTVPMYTYALTHALLSTHIRSLYGAHLFKGITSMSVCRR